MACWLFYIILDNEFWTWSGCNRGWSYTALHCPKCWCRKGYHQFTMDIWIFWILGWLVCLRFFVQKVSHITSWNLIYDVNNRIVLIWNELFFQYSFRYCKTATSKTAFLCLSMMINGLVMILLPFLKNFGVLVTCRCLQNLALGAFITADCRYVSIAR